MFWKFCILVFMCVVHNIVVVGQINSIPGTTQTNFYLDRYSDCDGRPREVGQSTVFISSTSTEHQGQPVTSCTITLSTQNEREPYRFKLQFLAVRIDEPVVSFHVYDGEANGRQLWAFNKQQQKPPNLEFDFTTGQLVTFRFSRGEMASRYDIRVVATPVPSQTVQCNYETEYGCDEYGYNYRILGTKEIAGIIAGCFALVFIIVIVVVICCYRKQKGVSQKWKEEKLGHVNTAASLHSLNGKVSHSNGPSSTKPWTSESSKNGFASIRRSPNLPRAKIARSQRHHGSDTSSIVDSNASLPMKRPLPPPNVNMRPGSSVHSGRRRRDRYEKYDYDDDRSSDRSFSTATKNFSERNYKPPTYREAIRHESESSADEHTFVGADDSQQQSVFIERVLAPRKTAKSSPQVLRAQKAVPPPEDDGEYDSIDDKKRSGKPKVVDAGTGGDDASDQSDTENESSEEEEESEEASDAETDDSDKQDKPDALYAKPDKEKAKVQKPSEAPPPPPAQGFRPPTNSNPKQFHGPQLPGFMPPGVHQPQPRYGYPQGQPQPFPMGQPPYNQGHPQYPQGQPMIPQGQPMFPQGQPQYPPIQQQYPQVQYPQQTRAPQPDAYHQANFSVPLDSNSGPMMQQPLSQPSRPREHLPSNKSNKTPKANVAPGNPPVYSYLVNRGYQSGDGRYSPLSTSTGASNLSGDRNLVHEDSDFSANLGSGVELMKRKN